MNSCIKGNCNCGNGVDAVDKGIIYNKNLLPIQAISFPSSGGAAGYYEIGRLRCAKQPVGTSLYQQPIFVPQIFLPMFYLVSNADRVGKKGGRVLCCQLELYILLFVCSLVRVCVCLKKLLRDVGSSKK